MCTSLIGISRMYQSNPQPTYIKASWAPFFLAQIHVIKHHHHTTLSDTILLHSLHWRSQNHNIKVDHTVSQKPKHVRTYQENIELIAAPSCYFSFFPSHHLPHSSPFLSWLFDRISWVESTPSPQDQPSVMPPTTLWWLFSSCRQPWTPFSPSHFSR